MNFFLLITSLFLAQATWADDELKTVDLNSQTTESVSNQPGISAEEYEKMKKTLQEAQQIQLDQAKALKELDEEDE